MRGGIVIGRSIEDSDGLRISRWTVSFDVVFEDLPPLAMCHLLQWVSRNPLYFMCQADVLQA